MKRCPECRRDYYDETLLYCLDDGSALLEGPASGEESDTAILHAKDGTSEANTRAQLHTTDRTAVLPSSENALGKNKKLTRPAIFLLAAILFAGAAFAYYKYADRAVVVSFEGATQTRVTDSGLINLVVISPDGKWLVYSIFLSVGQESLWLQQVGVSGSSKEILQPSAVAIDGVSFSSDGKYIYYVAHEKSDGFTTGTLYQIPFLGGTPKKVFSGISNEPTFSPDGKRIAYMNAAPLSNAADGVEMRLITANADGSDQRVLATHAGNEIFYGAPDWSPDGKKIAIVQGTIEPKLSTIATVSPESGEITPIGEPKFRNINSLKWIADGKSLLVLATEKSTMQPTVWQIAYPSGEPRKVTVGPNEPSLYFTGLSLSADSSVLVTNQQTFHNSLWTASVSDPTAATELKLGTNLLLNPTWAPDGRILYSKWSGDARELYIANPTTGTSKQLTGSDNDVEPAVSADGKFVVFTSYRSGNRAIWTMDLEGGTPRQLVMTGLSYGPSISPDGQFVYFTYAMNQEERLYKIAIAGGTPIQLTNARTSDAQISPDGKQVLCYYQAAPNAPQKVAIISSDGGTPIKEFAMPDSILATPRWMPDGRSFYYSNIKNYISNLWLQPVDGGPPKQYTNFTSLYMPWADVSRDGRIVYARVSANADAMLISGFKK